MRDQEPRDLRWPIVSIGEKRFRSYAISVRVFEGRRVALLDEDWLHIRFRHQEVGPGTQLLSAALAQPDEAYRNGRGGVHVLKRIDEQHFLVVIWADEQWRTLTDSLPGQHQEEG